MSRLEIFQLRRACGRSSSLNAKSLAPACWATAGDPHQKLATHVEMHIFNPQDAMKDRNFWSVEKIWSGQSARYGWDKIANFCGYYRYHHCMFNVPFSAIPTKNDIINFIPNSHSKVMIISENCGRVRKTK